MTTESNEVIAVVSPRSVGPVSIFETAGPITPDSVADYEFQPEGY